MAFLIGSAKYIQEDVSALLCRFRVPQLTVTSDTDVHQTGDDCSQAPELSLVQHPFFPQI
jgi:hypothetical protein